ncbi:WD repeat-containing protein 54 isoform X3 [Mauremys reevesii]|uniref:WD repeat-containing protein 54 isoform X3 n=1 Tax=Mauremys reevesii TaxID=260615 RepID=UPI00193F00E2|nr:WD repeat-containing protein 54 isoform X3 [Mauremys reevesii]
MYRKERSVPLKSSSSALYNNLSVLPLRDKQLTYFAAVHGSTVSLASASADGLSVSHRQLQAKEGGLAVSASIVTQASWCVLPSRVLLVLTSQKGIQMYESDGSIMVYWHALDVLEPPPAQAVFARGIAAASGRFICVGTSSGLVLVFDIPSKGTNITLSEVLEEHRDSITDITSEVGENPVDLLLGEAVERGHCCWLWERADPAVRGHERGPACHGQRPRSLDLRPGPGPPDGEAAVRCRGFLCPDLETQPEPRHRGHRDRALPLGVRD